jgi:predicted DNA-binding transcriptional regulator AlpA
MPQRARYVTASLAAEQSATGQPADQEPRRDGIVGNLPAGQCRPDNPRNANTPAIDREMLTVEDVAAMLAIGVRSVWRKSQDGRLPPPIRMTGSTRWAKSTLQGWIAEQATAASKNCGSRNRS